MCASLPFQPSAYQLPELMLYPIQFVSLFPFFCNLISLSLSTIPPLPSKEGARLANHLALGQELKERAQSPSEASILNTNSHRIAFVASSLSDQDPEEAFAPTSFSSEICNSKPSTKPSTFGKTTYLDANL